MLIYRNKLTFLTSSTLHKSANQRIMSGLYNLHTLLSFTYLWSNCFSHTPVLESHNVYYSILLRKESLWLAHRCSINIVSMYFKISLSDTRWITKIMSAIKTWYLTPKCNHVTVLNQWDLCKEAVSPLQMTFFSKMALSKELNHF